MDSKYLIGNGTTRAFNSEGITVQQDEAEVHLANFFGNLNLICGSLIIPCNLILWYSCTNNSITFHLKDDEHFSFKKVILDLESINQVNEIITKIKPREKPRANRYLHDGNVWVDNSNFKKMSDFFCSTSSSSDSDDSGSGATAGANNSFD